MLLVLLFFPLAAGAEEEERWDHRGALGLLAGGGVDFVGQVKSGGQTQEGTYGLVETLLVYRKDNLPSAFSAFQQVLNATKGRDRRMMAA